MPVGLLTAFKILIGFSVYGLDKESRKAMHGRIGSGVLLALLGIFGLYLSIV